MAEFKLGRLRFVWKGAWGTGTTYVKDDIIRYSGKSYVCVSGHTAAADFYQDADYGKWELMTDGTAWKQSPWSENTVYAIGDLVRYGGRVYICVIGHTSTSNVGRFDEDFDAPNNYWQLFADGVQWQTSPWTESTRYKTNDIVRYGGRTYVCVNDHTATATTGRFDTDYDAGNWQLFTDGTQWVGAWSTSTRYKTGDIISYGGKTYVAVDDHTSSATAAGGFYIDLNASKWNLYADGTQWKYLWNPSTYYKLGDIVKYNGWVYVCNEGHTSASTTTDGLEVDLEKWDIYAENIKYRGDWQPDGVYTTRYVINDVVKFGASTYICVTAHESGATFDETKWAKFVEGLQFEDAWSAVTEYQDGDVVTYGGYAYTATRRNTNKIPPEQSADWELLTTGFKFIGDFEIAQAHKIGNLVRYGGNTYVAIANAGAGETPVSHPAKWELLTESFAWKGEWLDATDYFIGDTVSWAGTTYRCINEHTSADPATPDLDTGTNWNVVAEGAEGNRLARRGDILTRSATQNIRLPRGLDGQILKVNGSDLEWKYFGEFPRVYYVATTGTDDPGYGTNWETPWRTIKYAMERIAVLNAGQELRSTVFVKTGLYQEEFPIVVPRGTSLVGDELRTAVVQPTPETSHLNKFLVQNWTTIRNFTWQGATGTLGEPNQYGTRRPTGGAWVSLDPGTGPTDETVWITTKSPYVQNVSTFGTGCVGMKVDGSLHNGGLKTMVYNDFTQILSDGIGAWITNQARAELVSVFSYYGHIGYLAENGGLIRATNGNSSYGTYGCVAEGVDPTEVSRTASVDNQRLEAQIGAVFTNGQGVVSLEYDNAGQNYTIGDTTYTFTGSGNNNITVSAVNTYNGGVTSVRILDSGSDYKAASNNAQSGDETYIRLSASDTQVTDGYVGERIVIIDGAGVGQYGWIYAYDGGSKIAKVAKESDNTIGWDTFWTGHAIETVLDSTSRYSIEPRPIVRTGNAFTSTAKTLPANSTWTDVAYGNGKFVAIASGATATANSTNGYIWEEPATGLPSSATWTSVGYGAGVDRFVAVASGGTTAAYSTNGGTVWTAATLPASRTWSAVTFGATNSVTYTNVSGTNVSGSGINATFNITREAGVYTVAVHTAGTGYAGYNTIRVLGTNLGGLSPDNDLLITVTQTTAGGIVSAVPTESIAIYGRFVAIASATTSVAYSPDGVSWTAGTMPSSSNWSGVTFGGTKYVAVASGGTAGAYSTDGITWTASTLPSSGTWASVAYGNGVYVAVRTGSTAGAYSTDGITWSATTLPNSNNWSNIIFANGNFWAIASGTDVAASSIDGINWSTRTLSASASWTGIAAGSNVVEDVLVAVAGSSTVATVITPPAVATATISKGVLSVGIDDVGGGYTTAPEVHFAGDGTSTGGSGATGVVTIAGSVASIFIKSAGTGYSSTPTISITGGGGDGATAHAVITDTISSVELLTAGTGFTTPPSVTVTRGVGDTTGDGAIISAQITNIVEDLVIGEQGSGYNYPPTVTITSPSGTGATATATITGTVTDIVINEGGSGYDPLAVTVVLSPASGDSPTTTAEAELAFDVFGTITNVNITNAGAGYTKPPIVELVGVTTGGGFSATAVITGSVTGLEVTAGGQAYGTTLDTTVTLSAPDVVGGVQATATANITGSVKSLTVVDGGTGYTVNPTLTISGGSGVNATAQVTARTKKISSIVVDSAGSGYTSNPAVSILGGDGVGAIARARISGTVQNVTVTEPGMKYDSGVPDVYFSGGNNYKSINAGLEYYNNVSGLTAIGDTQLAQTVDALTHLKTISAQIVDNAAVTTYQSAYSQYTLGGSAPAGTQAAVNIWMDAVLATVQNGKNSNDAAQILLNNRDFIRAEVIAYIDATYTSLSYDPTLCSRDVGLIVDAIAADLVSGGVYRTVAAGVAYYRNASAQIARGSQLTETLAGITHIFTLAEDILGNQLVTPLQLVEEQVLDGTLSAESGSIAAVSRNVDLIKAIVNNPIGSSTYTTAINLLEPNRTFIKAEVIAYINSSYTDFNYNQTLCARDVGYILDALIHDCIHSADYTALATATTTNVVDEISVVYGGSRFSSSATVGFSGGGGSAATAAIQTDVDGTITGFTINNHGVGYSSAPSVTITPDSGSGAVLRTLTLGGTEQNIRVVNPGSGYTSPPHVGVVDPNNILDVVTEVAIANGVLGQPSYSNRGTGYLSAGASVSSTTGYADIAQTGSYLYVRGMTNVPTPGANVSIDGDDTFYKLVTVREIVGPEGVVNARNLIVANKEFIQAEVIAHIDNFTYDETKCSRDVGLIIDALGYDQAFNSNYQSIKAAHAYYRAQSADVYGLQRFQTVGAMEYVIAQAVDTVAGSYAKARVQEFGNILIDIVKNGEEWTPAVSIPTVAGADTQDSAGKDLLLLNKEFIKAEAIAWINKQITDGVTAFVGLQYSTDACARDVGYIVDALCYDLAYEGNSATVDAGLNYYFNSTLVIDSADKAATLATYNQLDTIMQSIAQSVSITPTTGNTVSQVVNPSSHGDSNTASRISTLVGYITTIINSGTGSAPSITNPNTSYANIEFTTARSALNSAKATIQSDTISFVNTNYVNFSNYNKELCSRDVGLIIDAITTDIYSDTAEVIEAGMRYFANASSLEAITTQKWQTLGAIEFINTLMQDVITNTVITRGQNTLLQYRDPVNLTGGADASARIAELIGYITEIITNGDHLANTKQILLNNKEFIQAEVIAYVNATYENFTYNQELCSRDVGYIIDAICYDIYGGLTRSYEAALRYYTNASSTIAISTQKAETVAAINYITTLCQSVLQDTNPPALYQDAVDRSSVTVVDPTYVEQAVVLAKVAECITAITDTINGGIGSLPEGQYTARLQLSPPIAITSAPIHGANVTIRSQYSQVRLTGHDFLNVGTGNFADTNYPGIPVNVPDQANEIIENGGGRCFYTSTDQDGNFRVGELFRVEQATGIATLNADAFNLAGLNELSLGGITLGGTNATIREFSTDSTLSANSDNIVPTQKAVKTYIAAQLGSGGGNLAVNAITAGDVQVSQNIINTSGSLSLEISAIGGIDISQGIYSTSTSTGSLRVVGGVGIQGDLWAQTLHTTGLADIGANFTANGTDATVVLSPSGTGTVTISPTGGLTINPVATGNINNVNIGSSTKGTGGFTTLTATSSVLMTAGSSSSSTSTGTLVVTGGVGISQALYVPTASFTGTADIQLPAGTTAQRPGSGTAGMLRYNSDLKTTEYYNGASWVGSGGFSNVDVTSTYTAKVQEFLFINTSSGAVTVTLPATATQGDMIRFIDVAGTFGTNNLTLNNNGLNVYGVNQTITVNTNNAGFTLVYTGATYGWKMLNL